MRDFLVSLNMGVRIWDRIIKRFLNKLKLNHKENNIFKVKRIFINLHKSKAKINKNNFK